MSKHRGPCRPKVAKRNLHGSHMWWVTCTCGFINGWHEKARAQRCADEHKTGELCPPNPKESR